jgi:hypothetical protein
MFTGNLSLSASSTASTALALLNWKAPRKAGMGKALRDPVLLR